MPCWKQTNKMTYTVYGENLGPWWEVGKGLMRGEAIRWDLHLPAKGKEG